MKTHIEKASKVCAGLWRSWNEARAALPSLNWLAASAFVLAVWAVVQAVREGKSVLDIIIYGMLAFLFVLVILIIGYLLLEHHRHRRSDAEFMEYSRHLLKDHHLIELIRKISLEELHNDEKSMLELENAVRLHKEKSMKKQRA